MNHISKVKLIPLYKKSKKDAEWKTYNMVVDIQLYIGALMLHTSIMSSVTGWSIRLIAGNKLEGAPKLGSVKFFSGCI